MRWLSNTIDPKHKSARAWVQGYRCIDETPEEAWAAWQDWLKDKAIGRPAPTRKHSTEDLEAIGYVGVYAPEGDDA